ncbi:MAG: DnaJ domain-containing protein, partial [Myxococcales bacterium]|nr:DnaJ domain-containing protein [Myxococcales bacterium]
MARDLYETLGVPKDASEDVIKKAFRKQAAKYHPDRNPGKENEARFKELNSAHEVLGDKDKRALYDEFGAESLSQGFDPQRARAMRSFSRQRGAGGRGGSVSFQDLFGGAGGGGGVDFSDMFGDMFAGGRGRQARPRKAPDMEAEVSIDFVSSLKGTTVQLSHDSGETVTVRIPAGVSDGGRLRIGGQGGQLPGAQPGDLLLTVRVAPHPVFKREGDDLHLELPITVVEAYEGAKVRVPTADGEVALKVAPHTQSGQVARLRGKGVQRKGKPPGDLYVKFLIRLPVSEASEVKSAIEALRA